MRTGKANQVVRGFTVHINDTVPIEALSKSEVAQGQEPAAVAACGQDFAVSAPVSEAAISENVHRTGQVVDRYRIVKLIAEGGTSRVYEAVHQFTEKPVALKIMRHRLAERRDVLERFRQEAVVLASIRHENVVGVENAGLTEDGRVFIAMELLRGQTLRELLRRSGRLNQTDTVHIMMAVASGVSAAHAAGVAHRDLKPENIFCVTHGKVKVLDLGTAKFAGENAASIQTALGRVIGTAAYIAPERFNGEPGDVRSDIYALGLIAYECLAGHHALVPDGKWPNATEIASRQVAYQPGPIAGVSPALWRIISKAIQKSPGQRYRSALEFKQALREADRRCRESVEEPQLQLATESIADTRHKGTARRLVGPIVAGSVFGVVAAGALHWAAHQRLGTSAPSALSATLSSTQVDARLMATARLDARAPTPAAAGSSTTPMPIQLSRPVGAAQSAVAATRGRAPAIVSEPLLRTSPSAKPQLEATPTGVAAAEPVARTKGQSGPAGKALGEYESAPSARAPKDDLPASGL